MTWLRWVPRFIYGPDHLDFTLTYPVTRWSPGGRTTGRAAKTTLNVPGNTITLQKRTLALSLRFTEDEWWAHVRDFLLWAQHGYPFFWFPNDLSTVEAPVSYEVITDFPRVADAIVPTRDGTLIWAMATPIILMRSNGEAWDRDYMTLPAILPEDSVSAVPTKYLVSAADDTVMPGVTTLITAQLAAIDGTAIHQAGHFITFTVTGIDGTISELTAVTDDLGRAFTTLKVGAYLTVHTVHASDEDGRSGTSENVDVISGGTGYAVTADSYERFTTSSVLITAQLMDGALPITEAGHVVTWTILSGVGGVLSVATSVTDGTGKATVTLTFGTADTEYTVEATDELFATGISPNIYSADEGIAFLRLISNLEFAIDVGACAELDGGGALIGLLDHSGHNVAIALPGGAHNPTYEAAGWAITGGTLPRLTFDHVTQQWLTMALRTFGQPLTIVSVMDGFAASGAGQHNLVNLGGAIAYYHASWSQFAGNIVDSAFVIGTPANIGKTIRFDVFNGVTSKVYRGSTASGALNPGLGGSIAGDGAVGARADGVDAMTGKLAAIAIYSKALSALEMATIVAGFATRYPGLITS